ncbi:MAG: hypothetical protein RJQ09_06630 [Cyclobacteriaceae bacterium]
MEKLNKTALALSIVTILYNLIEGSISTYFGSQDDTLALFGFGVDSFVEVLSGIGITHMLLRMKDHEIHERDRFEIIALRITGISFYLLVAGLILGAAFSIIYKSQPETTVAGIVISSISILTMFFLYKAKLSVGKKLTNEAIISDANCTKTCYYLSFILLSSSLIYTLWQIPYVDAIGSLGIAWYAWKEGKEAFGKAKSKKLGCTDNCC